MVRRGGGSTQRLAAPIANGNPPPSTIAAQIVHNAANANGHHETESKVAFADLLHEYLRDPSTDEPNSRLNVQLISVVAEAGLDALLQDNPFALESLVNQAADSISAIKLTLERRPHLLLSPRNEEDAGDPHPPLVLWLLPKILGLLGRANLAAIHKHLLELMDIFLVVLRRAPSLWSYARCLEHLHKSCVDSKCPVARSRHLLTV
jgi:serine/threonine-protein kinase ATR